MSEVISDQDAEALISLIETGGLQGDDLASAQGMVDEWVTANETPRDDLDATAISAMGGDPEAAAQLAQTTGEGTVRAVASLGAGARSFAVGLAKMPLMLGESLLEDSEFTGTQATIKGALAGINDWYAGQRQKEIEWFQQNYGDPDANALWYFTGQALPTLIFSPGGPLFAAPSTFTRASALASLEGATTAGAIAAADAQAWDEITREMTLGGLFGLGAGMAFNAIPGVKAYAGRQLAKQFDDDVAQAAIQLERRVQEMTGNPDFSFTVGQIVQDNPWLVGLERGAQGSRALRNQNEQLNTLVEFLKTRSNAMSPEEILTDLNQTIVAAGRQRNAIARGRYGEKINQVLIAHGDQLAMPRANANQYLADLDDFIGELGDPRKVNAFDSSDLMNHRDFVRQKVNPFVRIRSIGEDGKVTWIVRDTRGQVEDAIFTGRGANTQADLYTQRTNDALGGLTSDDVVEILKGHNELISGEASAFTNAATGSSEHVGRRLMGSMMTAIDSADGLALKEIQNARNLFKFEMEQVRQLKNTAVGTIFGDDFAERALQDPDATLERLMNLGPAAQAQTRAILQTYDPATLQNLKQAVIRRALQGSREPGAAAVFNETSLIQLANNLSGKGRDSSVGRLGLGLFTPGEQTELIRTGQALRQLAATHTREISKDTGGLVSDLTINAISQSAEFMGRFISRNAMKGNVIEHLMIDPTARQALLNLAEGGVSSPMGKASLAYIAVIIGGLEGERIEKDQEPPSAAERR